MMIMMVMITMTMTIIDNDKGDDMTNVSTGSNESWVSRNHILSSGSACPYKIH